ncbi:L-proline glycine betaine ABC transport system permease protein ProW (TC 3.A.1.12.1) [Cronobacter dublinensis 1210]|uniref:L-proline glycine betaine ABC transport system permease protein ProW (TC 3.A.1.12.1) n=1 Tax=Cronobacter dublinensis 1210 TaxID=1208656 RepID=A0ABM9QBJ5_9ENTR|nr:L-proline glycine betaine ABC transport system permease protein ProW (TC 3.A.1.12.1) [Cronobacter dublinensis 1210]
MTDQTQNPWDTGTADAAANNAGSADAWGSPTPTPESGSTDWLTSAPRPRQNISVSWIRSIRR